MKKYFSITIVSFLFLSSALDVTAQTNPCAMSVDENGKIEYCPLEPIQGLTLDTTNANALPQLLQGLYMILFSLGGLLAVVFLTIGGVSYMMSSVPGIKAQGLERAKAAIYGILILVASYLILNTINPDLVNLRPLLVNVAQQNDASTGGTNGGTSDPRVPAAVCNSATSAQIQVKVYYVGDTCSNAVKLKLSPGDILNTQAQQSVIVFRSPDAIQQWGNSLDTFNQLCARDAGVVKTLQQTTTNNELIFVCLERGSGRR